MFWNKKPEQSASAPLISSAYLAQITQKHVTDLDWGTTGGNYADRVIDAAIDAKASSILDYGCGKGVLLTHLADAEELGNVALQGYDPAVDGFTERPMPADLVVCTDVLEHIEPDYLSNVLADLQDLCKNRALFVIASGPAIHKLPDGRNAHLIQQGVEWWAEKLLEFFVIDKIVPIDEVSFMVIARPWSETIKAAVDGISQMSDEQIAAGLKEAERRAAHHSRPGGRGLLGSFSYTAGE